MRNFFMFTLMSILTIFFGCHDRHHHNTANKNNKSNIYNVQGKYVAKKGKVRISWRLYKKNRCDSIDIFRNNRRIGTVPGNTKRYTDNNPPKGQNFYSVKGNPKGDWLPAPSIAIVVWEPERIDNFCCETNYSDGNILLTWTNGQEYDTITIICNGKIITIDGGLDTYLYSNNKCGAFTFEIKSTFGIHTTMSTFCETIIPELNSISSLACSVDHDTGNILINWESIENYDEINIKCGNYIIDTIDGSQTSYVYINEIYGIFDFQLLCNLGFRTVMSNIVTESVGKLVWDEDTSGLATGYYVYIWKSNEQQPENNPDNAACEIPFMNSITLMELFEMGAMPISSEIIDLKIALTAHDEEGNFSEFSNIVYCPWVTLLSDEVE